MKMTPEDQYRDDVYKWIECIKNWDCEDVYDLRDMIRDYPRIPDVENVYELQRYAEDQWEQISSDLPIATEYEERAMKHSSYPIWTCDKKGKCLVGETADSVLDIEYIENK